MKRIFVAWLAFAFSLSASAQFAPGQVLSAAALNAALGAPTITGGSINGATIGGTSPHPGTFTTLTSTNGITSTAAANSFGATQFTGNITSSGNPSLNLGTGSLTAGGITANGGMTSTAASNSFGATVFSGNITSSGNPSLNLGTGTLMAGSVSTSGPVGAGGYTVATLPACGTSQKGQTAYVTDAEAPTLRAALTGGGSSIVPVFCNGSSWAASAAPATISVTDCGAKGDNGTTDNYAAFNTCLGYLGAFPNGGTLHVPGGYLNRYVFKAQGVSYPTLLIPSNVAVVADPDVYYIVSASGLANSGVHTYGTALFTNAGWNTTGAKNIAVIGGHFKSANATSGATGNGGFLAFKNIAHLLVKDVQLLDIFGAARFQVSYSWDTRILNTTVDYETPHLTPWSFEDGLRIGSGAQQTFLANDNVTSGDDCLALNNETSETQDAFTSPVDSRIPAYNVNGASITGVLVDGMRCTNSAGHAVRIYGVLTTGTISQVRVRGLISNTTATDGTIIPITDTAGTNVFDIQFDAGTLNATNVTKTSGSPCLIQSAPDMILANLVITGGTAPSTYGICLGARSRAINDKIDAPVSNDQIYTAAADTVIEGDWLSGAGVSGIHLDNGASHTRMVNNRVAASTGAAITETLGASYTTAIGNDVQGATACSVALNTGSVYEKNPGYNPIGSFPIGPTGSPFTYTSANTTETVTVGGGTVSGITVNGQGTAMTSGSFTIPPHTSIVVTYSSGPTMTKTVH